MCLGCRDRAVFLGVGMGMGLGCSSGADFGFMGGVGSRTSFGC